MWQVLELEQWSCAGVVTTGKRLIVEHRRAIKSSLSFLEISANMYAIIINQWHAHPFEEMETRTKILEEH